MPRTRSSTKSCETPDKSLTGSAGREGKSILKRRERKPLQEVVDLLGTENANVTRSSSSRRVGFAVSEVREFHHPVNEGTLWGNSYVYDIQKSSSESEHTGSSSSDFNTLSSGSIGRKPGVICSKQVILEHTISYTIPNETEIEEDDLDEYTDLQKHQPHDVELIDTGNQTDESIFKELGKFIYSENKDPASRNVIFPSENLARNVSANKIFNPNDLFLQERLSAEGNIRSQTETRNKINNECVSRKVPYKLLYLPSDDYDTIKRKKLESSEDILIQQGLTEGPKNSRRQLLYNSVNKESDFSVRNADVNNCGKSLLSAEKMLESKSQNSNHMSSADALARERNDFSNCPHFQRHGWLSFEDQMSWGAMRSREVNENEDVGSAGHVLDLSLNNNPFMGRMDRQLDCQLEAEYALSRDSVLNDSDMSLTMPTGLLLKSCSARKVGIDGALKSTSDKCVRVCPEEKAKKSLCTVVRDTEQAEELIRDHLDNFNALSFTMAGEGLLERENMHNGGCSENNMELLLEESYKLEIFNCCQKSSVKLKDYSAVDISDNSISATVAVGGIVVNNTTSASPYVDNNMNDSDMSFTVTRDKPLGECETLKSCQIKNFVSLDKHTSHNEDGETIQLRSDVSVMLCNPKDNTNGTRSIVPPNVMMEKIMDNVKDTKSCCYTEVEVNDTSVSQTIAQENILCHGPTSRSFHITDTANVIDQSMSLTIERGNILDKDETTPLQMNDFVNVTVGSVPVAAEERISDNGKVFTNLIPRGNVSDVRGSSTAAEGSISNQKNVTSDQNLGNISNENVLPTNRLSFEELPSACHLNDFKNVSAGNMSPATTQGRILEHQQTSINCIDDIVNVCDEEVSSTMAGGRILDQDQVSASDDSFINISISCGDTLVDKEKVSTCHVNDLTEDPNKKLLLSVVGASASPRTKTNYTDNEDTGVTDNKMLPNNTKVSSENHNQLSTCSDAVSESGSNSCRSPSKTQRRANENAALMTAAVTGVAGMTKYQSKVGSVSSQEVEKPILDGKSNFLQKCNTTRSLDTFCNSVSPVIGSHVLNDVGESLHKNSSVNSMNISESITSPTRDKITSKMKLSQKCNDVSELSYTNNPVSSDVALDSSGTQLYESKEIEKGQNEHEKIQNFGLQIDNLVSLLCETKSVKNCDVEQKECQDSDHNINENNVCSISESDMVSNKNTLKVTVSGSYLEETRIVEAMEICVEGNQMDIDGSNNRDDNRNNRMNADGHNSVYREHRDTNFPVNFERQDDCVHSAEINSSETNCQPKSSKTVRLNTNVHHISDSSCDINLTLNNKEIETVNQFDYDIELKSLSPPVCFEMQNRSNSTDMNKYSAVKEFRNQIMVSKSEFLQPSHKEGDQLQQTCVQHVNPIFINEKNMDGKERDNAEKVLCASDLVNHSPLSISGIDYVSCTPAEITQTSKNSENCYSHNLMCNSLSSFPQCLPDSSLLSASDVCEKSLESQKHNVSSLSCSILDDEMIGNELVNENDNNVDQLIKSFRYQEREDFVKERGRTSIAVTSELISSTKKLKIELHENAQSQKTHPFSFQQINLENMVMTNSQSTFLASNYNEHDAACRISPHPIIRRTSLPNEINNVINTSEMADEPLLLSQTENSCDVQLLLQCNVYDNISTVDKGLPEKCIRNPTVQCEGLSPKDVQKKILPDTVISVPYSEQTLQESYEEKPYDTNISPKRVISVLQKKRTLSPITGQKYSTNVSDKTYGEFVSLKGLCQSTSIFSVGDSSSKFLSSVTSDESNAVWTSLCNVEKWIEEQQKR